METNAKPPRPAKSIQYYMRSIHRTLGYLAVGMVMIYALGGIILIHRTGDFMKKSTPVEMTVESNLNAQQLASELKMKNFKVTDENAENIYFDGGQYNKISGNVSYVKKEVVAPFNKFIDLHKLPDAKNPHIALATTIFGIVLFLLALTSLFMFKPASKQFKANMAYTFIGVLIAMLLVVMV